MRRTFTAVAGSMLLLGCCNRPAPAPADANRGPSDTAQEPPSGAPAQAAPATAPQAETPVATPLTDRQKIELLLARLSESPDTFNRNGSDYSGKDAAAHLRSKLSSAGDRIKTVRQFIDGLGSTSSMSGKPYTVKRADGAVLTAKAWFDAQLAEIEKSGK